MAAKASSLLSDGITKLNVPIPPPLRGNDPAGSGEGVKGAHGFTFHSIHVRLTAIIADVVASNSHLSPASILALEHLSDEIRKNSAVTALTVVSPFPHVIWDSLVVPHLGTSFMDAPWWFVENYVYRRILECTDYFTPPHLDPFATQKAQAIHFAAHAFKDTVLPLTASKEICEVILRSLWGNRADLSLSAGKVGSVDHDSDSLLVDDLNDTVALFDDLRATATPATSITIVVDNCGLEFLSDLVLCDALLRLKYASSVIVQCKADPVFVSDVTQPDVDVHLSYLRTSGDDACVNFADTIHSHLESGQLRIVTDPFWTTPLAMWECPATLLADMSQSALVITKGDANYRRLLGDRHWRHTDSFASILSYFPAPLVALRTCKSGICVGLSAAASLPEEADWLVSGKYGMVQLYVPTRISEETS